MADAARSRRGRLDWRYTETRRRKFLRVLAETYDVAAALAEARLTWPQVCELRVRHPDFAARFEEVIAAGYDRIEAMLLREAGAGTGRIAKEPLAQALLKQRRALRSEAPRGRTMPAKERAAMIKATIDMMGRACAPAEGRNGNGSAGAGRAGAPAGGAG